MRTLVWSAAFVRAFRRLAHSQPDFRDKAEGALQKLVNDPFHPTLHTHKLKGELAGAWSCTIDYENRILFEFGRDPKSGEEEIVLLAIGSHDEVY